MLQALGDLGYRERAPRKRGIDPSVRVDLEVDSNGHIVGGENIPRKVLINSGVNAAVDRAITRVTGQRSAAPAGVHRLYLKLEPVDI